MKEIVDKIKLYHDALDEKKLGEAFDLLYALEDRRLIDLSVGSLSLLLPLRPDLDTILTVLMLEGYLQGLFAEDLLFKKFGETVVVTLNSIKKLYRFSYTQNDRTMQLEVLRKMFLAMARDLRVILIILVDRLYKVTHIHDFVDNDHLQSFAAETLDVYVPIASRLGIYRIKQDLEDAAFQYVNPVEYKAVKDQIDAFDRNRSAAIRQIKKKLENFLERAGYNAKIFGRVKSVYSVYYKLKSKGLNDVNELYDIFAMRIILDDCYDPAGKERLDHLYAVLGLLHSEWRPLSRRFKDYIAVPKPNGYRSLHTVVLGLTPDGMDKPVEVQIRTESMNREAEYGIASHWIYKSEGVNVREDDLRYQAQWLKGLEHVRAELSAELKTLKGVELDVFKDRIFALTPRGTVMDLPQGAGPLDFAYAVHTDVGNHCVMAKVNGHVVPLDSELKNGDMVEIITRKDARPKLQWLSLLKTNMAKNKVKAWFNKFDRENNIKEGRKLINKQLERIGKPPLSQNYLILKEFDGKNLSMVDRETLLEELGKGTKIAADVVRKIFPYERILNGQKTPKELREEAIKPKDVEDLASYILVGGESDLPIKIGACCSPKFGDEIVAYVTRGNSLTVHKQSCAVLGALNSNRLILASWKQSKGERAKMYKIKLTLTVVKRVGLLRDLSGIISDLGVNIVDMKIEDNEKKIHPINFVLEFDDVNKFDLLVDKIENVEGVLRVVKRR